MIELEDMRRFMVEMVGIEINDNPDNWCDKEGIDPDAMEWLIAGILGAMVKAIERGVLQADNQAFESVVGSAFQIGWEAHKQMGRRERNVT